MRVPDLLAVLLLGACASSTAAPPRSTEPILQPSTPYVGHPAPDLSGLRPVNGDRVPSLRGRVTVLELGTTNCAGCVKLAPGLNAFAQKYPKGSVQVVHVVDGRIQSEDEVRKHVGETLDTNDFLVDPDGRLFTEFHVQQYPAVVVVDDRGRVRWLQETARLELVEEHVTDAVAQRGR